MGEKFCPKCGKQTNKLYESLCEECFLSSISIAKDLPEKIDVKQCRLCDRFFLDKISSTSLEDLVERFLRKFFKKEEVNSISYALKENKLILSLTSKVYGLEKTEEKSVGVAVKKIICRACSMMKSGYFQAVLQVRAPASLLEDVKKEIEKQVEFLRQHDELAFISKLEERGNGFDAYIGSKASANQIARVMKTKYKAKLKITKKFAGYVKGRRVYRDTILISIP